MSVVASVLFVVVLIFFLLLLVRLVLDWVQFFARDWRPRGIALVVAETVYTVTDPPIRFFRKLLPSVSFGPVALDFGWSLTMLVVVILMWVVGAFAAV